MSTLWRYSGCLTAESDSKKQENIFRHNYIQAGLKYVNQMCNGNNWKMKSPKQLDISRECNLIIGQYLTFQVENGKKLLFTRGIEGYLLNFEEHLINERAEELFHCVK